MEPQLSQTTPPAPGARRKTPRGSHKTPSPKRTMAKGPQDTPLRSSRTATEEYRASELDGARRIVCEDIGYVIRLPIDYLWTHCTLIYNLDDVKAHLAEQDWILFQDSISHLAAKDNFNRRQGLPEHAAFKPLADIFNQILTYPQAVAMGKDVRTMVNAGSASHKPRKISTNRPDAFLLVNSSLTAGARGPDAPYQVHWRDLTCLFEYEFGDGDEIDVRSSIHLPTMSDDVQNEDKLIWSLHHELRSDARRAFSFGVTGRNQTPCMARVPHRPIQL